MTSEIPEIEPCVCGIYPSITARPGAKNFYDIMQQCTRYACSYIYPSGDGIKFSECVHNWNAFIKREKFKKTYPPVCEKDWKEKTYEEYLEARKAIISLQLPFSVRTLEHEEAEKATNLLFKFLGCEFLEAARKELSTPHSPEEREKIMEKYFSIFSGETDDK